MASTSSTFVGVRIEHDGTVTTVELGDTVQSIVTNLYKHIDCRALDYSRGVDYGFGFPYSIWFDDEFLYSQPAEEFNLAGGFLLGGHLRGPAVLTGDSDEAGDPLPLTAEQVELLLQHLRLYSFTTVS